MRQVEESANCESADSFELRITREQKMTGRACLAQRNNSLFLILALLTFVSVSVFNRASRAARGSVSIVFTVLPEFVYAEIRVQRSNDLLERFFKRHLFQGLANFVATVAEQA